MLIADSIAVMIYEIRGTDSTLSNYQQSTNLLLVILDLGFLAYVNRKSSSLVYTVNIVVTLFTVYNLLSQSNEVYNLVISYLSLSIVVLSNVSLIILDKISKNHDVHANTREGGVGTSGPTYIQDFEEQIDNLKPKRLDRCKIRDKCKPIFVIQPTTSHSRQPSSLGHYENQLER